MIILGITSSSDRNAPDAPTIGTATNVGTGRAFNNGRADVTFTAPSYTGGSDIVSYTVTSSPGGFTGTGSASPISVTGLQSGVAYTFTVTATNAVGFTSAASAASNSITATTVPQAPTIGTATALDASATVAFTAGATGGSAITTFTATSSPGSITGTGASSPITVVGLTNGTAYTFTVTATNANGTSQASAASNSITPVAGTSYDLIQEMFLTGTSTTSSNIPQDSTYKYLILRGWMYMNSGYNASTIGLRFNNDSGNNYSYAYARAFGMAGAAAVSVSQQGISNIPLISNANINGNQPMYFELMIPRYNQSSYIKTTHFQMGRVADGGNSSGAAMFGSGVWNNSSAITSVTIFHGTASPASFQEATVQIIGVKDSI